MSNLLSLFMLFCLLQAEAQNIIEEAVSIGQMQGTLTTPKKKTKTAILQIAGSGPTDRNGNSAIGLTNNSLQMMAHSFVGAGYAVLRYDKRGIAESKNAVEDPSTLRFDDFVTDAKSWLRFLSERGYQNLIVVGHSQGSLVAIMAAQDQPKVKGLISIAGVADEIGYTLVKQLQLQAPVLVEQAQIALDSMRGGHTVNNVHPMLNPLFGPQIQDFLRSYMAYTPSEEITKLSIPVLVVNGTTDLQVSEEDAKKLGESYSKAELLIIDGMNHVLKDVAENDIQGNMATYNQPDLPLSDGLMDGMITFIKKL